MKATLPRPLTWHWLRDRVTGRSQIQQDRLRTVAARLAALTVGLLTIMLIALEIGVYLIVQGRLLASLQDTLRARASIPANLVCLVSHLPCPGAPPGQVPPPQGQGGGPGPGRGRHGFNTDLGPSDVTSVFVSPDLKAVHVDGGLGTLILDRSAVRQALRTQVPQGFDVKTYSDQTYLIYTAPLIVQGQVIGAVQNSISETQYLGTLSSMRETLLIIAILGLAGSSVITAILVQRALQPIRVAMQRQRDFVADAAHELRTPLAIQRTVAEVAMAGPAATDDPQTTIEQMMVENHHLTRLVEDLSLLARADTNTIAIDRQPVNLSELVEETSHELAYLAEDQGHTLDTEVAGGVHVTGDILRLRQLLLILIDNALKHTPAGGTVTVRLPAIHGHRARLEVSDSGAGISSDDLPRIFDRFYRVSESRTGEGTGLGLAIARWIVEAHGGHIQAGNVSPRGAVFTVTLPAPRSDTRA